MVEIDWNRLTAEALRSLAEQDAVVLLPVASTEQHGPHLPTGVDDILVTEACRRTARLMPPHVPAVVAPTVWCGLADHHLAFGGTFTLSLATYHALLRDLCRSILGAGFRRIVIVNGHGGNIQGLAAIAIELTRELAAPVATATYFMGIADEAAQILEDQDGVMHACEAETSMMMAVQPGLVQTSRLPEAHGPAFMMVPSLLPTLKRFTTFDRLTPSGVAGDARRAHRRQGRGIAGRLRSEPGTTAGGQRAVERRGCVSAPLRLAMTGDSILQRRLLSRTDPVVRPLFDLVQGADAAVANLEVLPNDYRGDPALESSGSPQRNKQLGPACLREELIVLGDLQQQRRADETRLV